MDVAYALSMGLFVVIIIAIKVALISFKVAMIAILIKTLQLVILVALCYLLVRRIQMGTHVICDWCGTGVSVNSKSTIRLHINNLDYTFDKAECLVRWLYSKSLIVLEPSERLLGVPLMPQEDG